MATIETIKQFEYFKNLSNEALEIFIKNLSTNVLKKNEVLVREKEPQNRIFLVESGELRRVKANPNNSTTTSASTSTSSSTSTTSEGIIVGHVKPFECCGLLHAFNVDPAFATIEVISEQATIFSIEATKFVELFNSNQTFSNAMFSSLALELRKQSKIVRTLQLQNSNQLQDSRLKICFFDSREWVVSSFQSELQKLSFDFVFKFVPEKLSIETASIANGFDVVCVFVNDFVGSEVVKALSSYGVKLIALRCAGFDNVDIEMAETLGITVVRVPAYSPYAVAEHAIAMLLALNRRLHKAYARTREGNFSLDGLLGFDFYGKTVGVIGTGKIGQCLVNICLGFGCRVICYDIFQAPCLLNREDVKYVDLDTLFRESHLISLHAPLTSSTHHMINNESIQKMRKGVFIVNTSRGGLVDTSALITAIESGHIGAAALDVYEGEKQYFFKDCSNETIADPILKKLLSFSNVLVTGHQAFFTQEALSNIANTTLNNIIDWQKGNHGRNHKNGVFKQ
eukprot:TRINITY_DN6160_c0_g1_i2.p1 TRINITY_DN6160_c0_g1~~TRINITY_DN6160_c0_g1_i2.p1  ORF type:complete len:512 (+),score=254.07 TRINITY_DN6160_c0_g1_i2:51-1586(+)